MSRKNLKMNNDLGNRLKKIREYLEMSVEKISKAIGEKPYRIRDIERGKQKCPPELLKKYVEYFQVNLDWLILGEGPMFKEEEKSSYMDEDEYVYLPLLEGGVTAGPNGGILYEQPDDMYPFKRSWIELKFGKSPERHKALILVRVQGDSMIPTISPGEVAMVDTFEHDRVYIRNGKIYMVRMPDGGITLKRIVVSEKGKIVCISDNPKYEPFEFVIEEGKTILWYVLGRIRWVGREID